jgi:hypothetical protein
MSVENRMTILEVPQTMRVLVCNQGPCEHEAPEDNAPDWFTVTTPYNNDRRVWHFCSREHLAQWAERQAAKEKANT